LILFAITVTSLGHYRDSKSKILTNLIVFLSPIELFVYTYQAYALYENLPILDENNKSLYIAATRNFYLTIGAIGFLFLANLFGLIFYLTILKKDEGFKAYNTKNSKLVTLVVAISSIFSNKVMKVFSSRLFGLS
jgi:hypothetical protein